MSWLLLGRARASCSSAWKSCRTPGTLSTHSRTRKREPTCSSVPFAWKREATPSPFFHAGTGCAQGAGQPCVMHTAHASFAGQRFYTADCRNGFPTSTRSTRASASSSRELGGCRTHSPFARARGSLGELANDAAHHAWSMSCLLTVYYNTKRTSEHPRLKPRLSTESAQRAFLPVQLVVAQLHPACLK